MDSELRQMDDMAVFDYDSKPSPQDKLHRTHFVLKLVFDGLGHPEKFKARLVFDGNNQDPNTYDAIRSPTARASTVKLLFCIGAHNSMIFEAFDVKGAYLHCEVETERIFVRLPNGQIAMLNRWLYGTKQAGLQWCKRMQTFLTSLGFTQSAEESCLYVHHEFLESGSVLTTFALVYVDDILIAADKQISIDFVYNSLTSEFGDVRRKTGNFTYLSIFVQQRPGYISLTMPGYVDKMLERLDAKDMRPVPSPFFAKEVESDMSEATNAEEYLAVVGLINYYALNVRPDLLYILSVLAAKCSSPTVYDLSRAMRVVAYVKGTKHHGLKFYSNSKSPLLIVYADASLHVRSRSGYCLYLNNNSACFFARSVLQVEFTPALSSTEAEYIALFDVSREVVYFRGLLKSIGCEQPGPTTVFQDNTSAIAMANGGGSHQRNLHYDLRLHYVRELVRRGTITCKHCPTEAMIADVLTKTMAITKFTTFSEQLLG